MKLKKKPVKIILISILSVCLLLITVNVGCKFYLLHTHNQIMNSEPDTSSWILENNNYKIEPEYKDRYISFTVEDKNGDIVFDFNNASWRAWDFKTISIQKDNDIFIDTGDMGKQIYEYKNNEWILK